MADNIRLLSDHLANQIAAGEVIQRPASAVKELMENAIDAGATDIQLILKDAGKELIQVTDNGSGMSPADARMAFERHATSKIRDINDLFSIRTMGFRGEALASVAAVAQVEMRTCPQEQSIGTRLVIEGTEVKLQEPAACPKGTTIQIKNLFFNVPARRHFLKSNSTELRHILDEFTRIALAHPELGFRLTHNGAEQYRLEPGSLKSRLVQLLGNHAEKNLVPVQEDTEFLSIRGFIGKPEIAAKTRGSQFFFINNRFIRNAYLHHAVTTAYEGLLAKESFPFYVLFLETDPARVDVNVHPTKQEVKFEDDRLMYAYLQAAVKHALARHNIAPSLDFTLNPDIQQLSAVQVPQTEADKSRTQSGYLSHTFSERHQAHKIPGSNDYQRWKEVYEIAARPQEQRVTQDRREPLYAIPDAPLLPQESASSQQVLSVQGALLVTTVKSGLMLVHMRRAQERIWYQRLQRRWQQGHAASQRLLYPISMELPPAQGALLMPALPDLTRMGLDISPMGGGHFVVQSAPPELQEGAAQELIEVIIDRLEHSAGQAEDVRHRQLTGAMAFRLSFSTPPQNAAAQQALIDELFACEQPEYTPGGKKVFSIIHRDELDKLL